VKKIVDRFVQLYDPTFLHKEKEEGSNLTSSGFPWSSIQDLAKSMELDDLAARDAGDYYYSQGVGKLFTEEIIEAATLVNYGQEIYAIHGVGGGVSLAASGAVGVTGGNYRIFEEFLAKCENLKLRLGVHGEVTGLARFKTVEDAIEAGKLTRQEAATRGHLNDGAADKEEVQGTTKWWLGTKSGYGDLFDAVFVAVPWHSSGITLMNTQAVIPAYDYVHLHVTILVTTAKQPNPIYFGRGEGDSIPTSILTSHISIRKEEEERKKEEKKKQEGGKKKMEKHGWWPGSGQDSKKGPQLEVSMTFASTQRESAFGGLTIPFPSSLLTIDTNEEEGGSKEHIVKLFSSNELSDSKLDEIFGEGQVKWVYRKEWDAYPCTFCGIDNDNKIALRGTSDSTLTLPLSLQSS
jgi:prenylcysteine oxidase/farnesylcysteine lyase